jgi:membrane protein DedA with SNARE-associated domain
LGERRLKQLANKYGRWLTISSEDIDRAKGWFNRHGGKAVLIGRIVPGIRTLISVPAGMSNMPLLPFLFYTTLGSATWVALLTYSRYWLGIQYELVEKYLAPVSKIVLGGLLVILTLGTQAPKSRNSQMNIVQFSIYGCCREVSAASNGNISTFHWLYVKILPVQ